MPKFKPNAYGEFVSEFRRIKLRENITYPSFDAASAEASIQWQGMSKENREKYKLGASRRREASEESVSKNSNNMKKSNKKTSQGKLLTEVMGEEERTNNLILEKQEYVSNLIRNAAANNVLGSKVFSVIHTNTYLTDIQNPFHAEIALTRFSLEKGIISSIYTFINHKELPTGFVHDAKDRYEREHRIVLPPNNKVLSPLKDYATFYFEVKDFLTKDPDGYCHLYALNEQMPLIESFFKTCSSLLDDPFLQQNYIVHSYMDLFLYIMSTCYKKDRSDAIYKSLIRDIVDRDVHDMLKSLACSYHYEVDALASCAFSKAKRLAHYICEECSNELNVYMVKGLHFPREVNKDQKFKNKTIELNAGPSMAGIIRTMPNDLGAKPKPQNNTPIVHKANHYPREGARRGGRSDFTSSRVVPEPKIDIPKRDGATAACSRHSRGGLQNLPPRDYRSSSDDEEELPHNDVDYAHLKKPWEIALSARDVDPSIDEEDVASDEDYVSALNGEMEELRVNHPREVETPNSFPRRKNKGNIAAKFDKQME